MNDPNEKRIWEAVDWHGEYKVNKCDRDAPSNQQFKSFFEAVYNPQGIEVLYRGDLQTNVLIIVLDALIQIDEV